MSLTTLHNAASVRDVTGVSPVRTPSRARQEADTPVPVDRVSLSPLARLLSLAAPDPHEDEAPVPVSPEDAGLIDAEFEALEEDEAAAPQPTHSFDIGRAAGANWRRFVATVVSAHAGLQEDAVAAAG